MPTKVLFEYIGPRWEVSRGEATRTWIAEPQEKKVDLAAAIAAGLPDEVKPEVLRPAPNSVPPV